MSRKFRRCVKSITVTGGSDDTAGQALTVVYRRKGKKKRSSRYMRPMDKLVRRFARGEKTFFRKYLDRHYRSNKKRKDGWVRDIISNTARAITPAVRRITR